MTLRVFSYGGGVQSTAALVLAAQGKIDFPVFLFANVGDDSEEPGTLEFLDKWAKPYAETHGIVLHELRRTRRGGEPETLHERLLSEGATSGTVSIPVRLQPKGPPVSRSCTSEFKIKVIAKWLKAHGATNDDPASVGIGISTDEIGRMNTRRVEGVQVTTYPLIDLRLNRADCAEVIRRAGMPVPPKSSCYFCPFHSVSTWTEMRRDKPDLFAKSVALEAAINARRAAVGKGPAYFNSRAVPLTKMAEAQTPLFADEPETCDVGSCFT